MKKLIYFIIIILFFSTRSLYAETTIRITNGEWEPFMSEYCPYYGINSHVVSEAFKLEGIKIIWEFFPWKRAYQMAKEGKFWDASATWWPADETREAFYISEPVSNTSFVFFHLKNFKFNWNSYNDLKELKIGGTLEYDYGNDFINGVKENGLYVEYVPTDEQNLAKILKGRINIFPNDPIVGYSQIRNTFPPDKAKLFTHHPKIIDQTTLHLIISKNCKKANFFLNKFNSGLEKLKDSGRFDQMFKDLEAGKYDKQKVKWQGYHNRH